MSNFTCLSISAANATGLRLVWIVHHIGEHRGHDLPPHAVLIDDPAAGLRFSAIFLQGVPVGVDLRLRTAVYAERDGFVEGIVRAGTHRHECLAEQGEVDDDD